MDAVLKTDQGRVLMNGLVLHGAAALLAGFALVYYRRGFRDGAAWIVDKEPDTVPVP